MERSGKRVLESEASSSPVGTGSIMMKSILACRRSLRISNWGDALDEDIGETLEGFLNRGWDIYHCSPLFGVGVSKVHLKQYSLQLRNYCAAMDVQEDVQYTVEIRSLDDHGISDNDRIIQVEIICHKENNEVSRNYSGYFMSWGAAENTADGMLYLPVLLCKARSTTFRRQIHEAFQKLFDCVIQSYTLSEMQLMWLNSLFLSISKDASTERRDVVKLTVIPALMPDTKNKLELYLVLSDLKKIWAKIHHQDNDTISYEETRKLYDGIKKTLSEKILIQLSGFIIYEIKYPDVTIRSTGKVSCKTAETLNELLLFLYKEKPCINFTTVDLSDDPIQE